MPIIGQGERDATPSMYTYSMEIKLPRHSFPTPSYRTRLLLFHRDLHTNWSNEVYIEQRLTQVQIHTITNTNNFRSKHSHSPTDYMFIKQKCSTIQTDLTAKNQ